MNQQHIKHYTTNAEYRQCLRELFKMNPDICKSNISENWDEETNDEMLYDNNAVSKMMDYVYDNTKHNIIFQQLYDKAAARMLSQDREIGLCILFSYDFLLQFHPCLVDFLNSPDTFNKANPNYIVLNEKLA